MKLSSALDALNEQFKHHGQDYLSLTELCEQAVRAPKSSVKLKKKLKTKSGYTSCNSVISDSDISTTTPIRSPPSTTKKLNWRMSLFDTTSENSEKPNTRVEHDSNVIGDVGLMVSSLDKPSNTSEPPVVDATGFKQMHINAIVGLDSSLDWSVDVAREWLYVSRIKTTVSQSQLINFVAGKLGTDIGKIQGHTLIKNGVDISSLNYVSFKLGVPKSFVGSLMDPSFWPKGILVKPFVSTSKNSNQPKNIPLI